MSHNMPLQKSYFNSVNIGAIPRFITGKKLDIWDNSLHIKERCLRHVLMEGL